MQCNLNQVHIAQIYIFFFSEIRTYDLKQSQLYVKCDLGIKAYLWWLGIMNVNRRKWKGELNCDTLISVPQLK